MIMAEKSPLRRLFKKVFKNVVKITSNRKFRSDYCLPDFRKTLLVFYMPMAPAWTGIMMYSNENRQTRYFVHEFVNKNAY